MQVPEREAFLRGFANRQESTSMSTMVQIVSDATQPAIEPVQAQPIVEESEQPADAAMEESVQPAEEVANDPEPSAETTMEEAPQQELENLPVVPSDQPDPEGIKKDSDSVKQEDDSTDDEITADDLVSLVATAGSVGGDAESAAYPRPTQGRRNNLARYVIGGLGLDSFIDIFNVLCASASRYVDSVGTFVRKLSLSESSPQVLELIGEFDPVIVFVDSEIEEAIRTLAGDLSLLGRKYPSQQVGIDWITFQYHLTLLQADGPTGWDAPGFRMGGRLPMSTGDICQRLMTHDEFKHCHSTPIRDWQRVRHMATLGRNPAIRENYVHDAVHALTLYAQRAREADPQLEELAMDDMMMMVDYDDLSSQLDTLSEAIRTGTGVPPVSDSRMEERERRARQAEAQLIQSIEEEAEARARRFQKKQDKKVRRSHSSTQPANPTVLLLNYQPPREPSDEEGEVEPRRLDFDEGSLQRTASTAESTLFT